MSDECGAVSEMRCALERGHDGPHAPDRFVAEMVAKVAALEAEREQLATTLRVIHSYPFDTDAPHAVIARYALGHFTDIDAIDYTNDYRRFSLRAALQKVNAPPSVGVGQLATAARAVIDAIWWTRTPLDGGTYAAVDKHALDALRAALAATQQETR